ncbi:MAG: methyltransferase domain-containing protein [Oscillospiraceae bacterium]|jgi:SAM-dependent methyltransferase|nr:methyltransferase domain-containing protein [Oscillospiraceae bacterium]
MSGIKTAYAAAYADGTALCSTNAYGDLSAVPEEVRNARQGCGSPTGDAKAYIKRGDVVVDLGCGAGLDAFLAALLVGERGRVVGVDFTPEALSIARRNAFPNMEFEEADFRELPLADCSADVIISNCAINLAEDKTAVFAEIYRVLKPGGRFVISDITAFQPVPLYIRHDREMLKRCIGGALEFAEFAALARRAGLLGFGAVSVRGYARIDGLDFVSVTAAAHKVPEAEGGGAPVVLTGPMSRAVTEFGEFRRGETRDADAETAAALRLPAYKPYFSFKEAPPVRKILPKSGACRYTGNFAVLTGAFSEIEDDDGHICRLGEPIEVCGKTSAVFGKRGYRGLVTLINRAAGRDVEAADAVCGGGCC